MYLVIFPNPEYKFNFSVVYDLFRANYHRVWYYQVHIHLFLSKSLEIEGIKLDPLSVSKRVYGIHGKNMGFRL